MKNDKEEKVLKLFEFDKNKIFLFDLEILKEKVSK